MRKETQTSQLYYSSLAMLLITACGPQATNLAESFPNAMAQHDLQSTSPAKDSTDVAPPEGSNGCAAGFCKLPQSAETKTVVQLPDQVEVQPIKIINTSEKQIVKGIVDYHITRHVYQPVEIRHTVYEHRNLYMHDL